MYIVHTSLDLSRLPVVQYFARQFQIHSTQHWISFNSKFLGVMEMRYKPNDLRVVIPKNRFKKQSPEHKGVSALVSLEQSWKHGLGLSGPLKSLMNLNKELDEALHVSAFPSSKLEQAIVNHTPKSAPGNPTKAESSESRKRGTNPPNQLYQNRLQVYETGMVAVPPITELLKSDANVRIVMLKEQLLASHDENKVLREALMAMRDVLFYEISRREKAEILCHLARRRDLKTPRCDGASTSPSMELFNATHHYSIHSRSRGPSQVNVQIL